MKTPDFVMVLVILPLLFTSYPIIGAWYSLGTVTSTFIIGSKMTGPATLKVSLKEALVAIPKARELESTVWV